MKNVAIFASGEGSNFEAILNAVNKGELLANIVLLISNNKEANVIKKASGYKITASDFNPKSYVNKEDYENHILQILKIYYVEWIVLAGYVHLIGKTILDVYEGKVVNIHPSLLPNFPGKDAILQALNSKAKVTGVTIHYVDKGIDTGSIISQKAIKVSANEILESLKQRINKV